MGHTQSSYCEKADLRPENAYVPWSIFMVVTILLSLLSYYFLVKSSHPNCVTPFLTASKTLKYAIVMYHIFVFSNAATALLTTVINSTGYDFCIYDLELSTGHSMDSYSDDGGRNTLYFIYWLVYWCIISTIMVRVSLLIWHKTFHKHLHPLSAAQPVQMPQNATANVSIASPNKGQYERRSHLYSIIGIVVIGGLSLFFKPLYYVDYVSAQGKCKCADRGLRDLFGRWFVTYPMFGLLVGIWICCCCQNASCIKVAFGFSVVMMLFFFGVRASQHGSDLLYSVTNITIIFLVVITFRLCYLYYSEKESAHEAEEVAAASPKESAYGVEVVAVVSPKQNV